MVNETPRDRGVTWAEFHDLFMVKYFPDTARHAKAQEFLDLKPEAMTLIEYVARFTELARFTDDYVATDMAKVKRFENGQKLSIRGRIIGLRLKDIDSMVGTALTIERERSRMLGALGMRVLVARGRRVSLLLVRERSRRLLVHVGSRAAAIRARDGSKFPFRLGRWYDTIASNPDMRDCPKDKDPRVSGQHSPSQRWDKRGYSIFLHSPVQVKGASISFRELHGHLPLHRQAREARLYAEVEDEAHRQGRQGFRGVSMLSHHRLSWQISQSYRVRFCYLTYGKECYLILVLNFHSLLHQL